MKFVFQLYVVRLLTSMSLTVIGPCIANVSSEYNQQDATFLKCIYFCKTLYMFQTVFYLLLAVGSSNGLTTA